MIEVLIYVLGDNEFMNMVSNKIGDKVFPPQYGHAGLWNAPIKSLLLDSIYTLTECHCV